MRNEAYRFKNAKNGKDNLVIIFISWLAVITKSFDYYLDFAIGCSLLDTLYMHIYGSRESEIESTDPMYCIYALGALRKKS